MRQYDSHLREAVPEFQMCCITGQRVQAVVVFIVGIVYVQREKEEQSKAVKLYF